MFISDCFDWLCCRFMFIFIFFLLVLLCVACWNSFLYVWFSCYVVWFCFVCFDKCASCCLFWLITCVVFDYGF